MAKKTDKDKTAEETAPAEEAQAPAQQQVELQVNDDEVICSYSNFCRVTGSPEELIVDFGLNPNGFRVPRNPIDIKQRIVLNYFTAKRLLAALSMSVQNHERVFGVLETDVNKRVTPQVAAAQAGAAGANAPSS
ncbi:MAG: DUF3467 domain-containing protein [Planctomycetaceae bacterium]|nr:DUF3467 domain-containing protein [Planctomycetaceae bacterium]